MYAPLYIKTNNSILSSMIKIKELISFAKENNIKALTITDDTMYGVYDFYKECIKNDIKPIIGLVVKIKEEIILYAKNYEGYINLIKLSTIQSERTITPNDLLKYNKNIICILTNESNKYYDKIIKIYKSDLYMSYNLPSQRKKINKPCVFMNETLYLEKKDEQYINYLYAIKDGIKVSDVSLNKKNNYIIKEEMLKKLPIEDLENNKKIVEQCNIEIKPLKNLLPKFDCPDNMDSYTYLKKKCIDGLRKKIGDKVPKLYVERLKHELEIIKKMGFCDYFLVVSDFIEYAKNNDIYIGPGRGSAAGALVSYLTDITTIDPLKYNLLFERFLNPERVTMPDIDVDIEDTKRQLLIDYCIKKYGEKRVVPIIAFGTMKAKQAIRDVGRVMEIENSTIDYISKQMDSNLTLASNLQNNRLKEYIDMDPKLKKLYEVAMKFEDIKRTTTIHAAGVIMSNTDIDNIIPLDKSHKEFYTTAFDMTYLEEIGLLKMDFLALSHLGTIHNLIDDVNIKIDEIPENDIETIKIFNQADMLGIFQFENQGMINFIRKFKPTSFEDIVAAIALYRPGPMQFIDSYIKRKNKQEKIDYIDPSLISILRPTYGIIIYQEQIMQVAQIMAGYSLGEADILRRAMSKKKESIILEQKDIFIKRSTDLGHKKEIAQKVYEMILKFASYGFNRSHSVAYSKVAYIEAYLKAHYREYFMKNQLNTFIGSDKVKDYIYDCKKHGLKIISPSINKSDMNFTIMDKNIIYPLTGIKGIGKESVKEIIKNRPYIDIYDFFKKCYSKTVNKKIIENLAYAGCFDELNINRQTIINNIEELINYGEISNGLDFDIKPELKEYPEYSNTDLLFYEEDVIGFYLSNHPTNIYYNNEYKKINNLKKDRYIKTILLIDRIKIINTKKGEKMAFLTGSDENNNYELVCFPRVYNDNLNIRPKDVCMIDAKIDLKDSKYQLIINDIKKLV